MRIAKLVAENFKRLHAVEITPTGDIVNITGRNGQGKTSVLDALWVALAGKGVSPTQPIRKGADGALIRVDLGKYIVTRTFERKDEGGYTTSIKVENADGARFPTPQKMLDEFLGELSFDPLAFTRMDRKSQFDTMRKFVPGVDFEAIDNAQRGDFERRAEVNRKQREAQAAANAIAEPAAMPERVDEAALVAEMSKATAVDQAIAAHLRESDGYKRECVRKKDEAAAARAQAVELRQRALKLEQDAEACMAAATEQLQKLDAMAPPPQPIDVAAIAGKLNQAREVNRSVDVLEQKIAEKRALVTMAKTLADASEDLTAKMDQRQADKQAAIAAAKMPVPGITFGEGCVLLDGVPFEQGSDAEQLRTSVAIAASLNPTLRVIRIRDGSLLDEQSMKWLAEFAKERDLQIWIEVVGTDAKVGVLIEDGRVAS